MLGFKKMNKQVACATSLDCSSHVELQPAADLNLFNHAELILDSVFQICSRLQAWYLDNYNLKQFV